MVMMAEKREGAKAVKTEVAKGVAVKAVNKALTCRVPAGVVAV